MSSKVFVINVEQSYNIKIDHKCTKAVHIPELVIIYLSIIVKCILLLLVIKSIQQRKFI